MKALGVARVALDATQPHQREERFAVEPSPRMLRREVFEEQIDFARGDCVVDLDIDVGRVKITVVLGDLVLENRMVADSMPRATVS